MLHHTFIQSPVVYTTHNVLPVNSNIIPIYQDSMHTSLPKLEDSKDAYFYRFETPGLKKEDINVEMVGRRTLSVTAGAKQPAQGEALITEPGKLATTSTHMVYQRADLPVDADWSQMQLTYEDGVLTVKVQKRHGRPFNLEGLGEKTKELEEQAKECRTRVDSLRAELEKEQRESVELERALREEIARAVATEKRQLTFA